MRKIIMSFLGWVLSPLIDVLNLPVVPAELSEVVSTVLDYVHNAVGLLNLFVPMSVVQPALAVVVAVYVVHHGYTLLVWVLRKIPFVGVD